MLFTKSVCVRLSFKGERHYAWLIIIQPFGSNRHDAYVVDGETQEVKSLYES
ncbi:hypothetical protein SC09_Contig19orf00966 [Bacillus subtilis]|uniref:Transposase n=1 Tax=Bacillus subtilis TaxID=1423 RepID=A0A0D1L284_BACIU|nr:hypothetical protein SC09_Contig19orf00966 [Bacillus subtilis]